MPIRPENRGRYPADWPAIRARILERAGHRCEWCRVHNHAVGHRNPDGDFVPACGSAFLDLAGCGQAWPSLEPLPYAEGRRIATMANESGHPDEGRWIVIVLTIAHLDHTPENNEESNLAALCQQCHNRHDVADRAASRRNRQSGYASDLIQLAAENA